MGKAKVYRGALLGKNVTVGHNVVVYPQTIILDHVVIGDGAVLGRQPSPVSSPWTKVTGQDKPLVVGYNVTIGTGTIIYVGCIIESESFISDLAALREGCQVGKKCIIGRGVTMERYAEIGDESVVSSGAHIGDRVKLGCKCIVAPNACIINAHRDDWNPEKRDRWEEATPHPPTIEDEVSIATNAVIVGGITIGHGAIIGAGAVVLKDIPAGEVWAGNPARRIR